MDEADNWIAERAKRGDIVITADVPLASRAVKAGAEVIAPNGKPFTEESIGMALATRNLMDSLRSAGEITGGPKPFSPRDRSEFLSALDRALVRLTREGFGRHPRDGGGGPRVCAVEGVSEHSHASLSWQKVRRRPRPRPPRQERGPPLPATAGRENGRRFPIDICHRYQLHSLRIKSRPKGRRPVTPADRGECGSRGQGLCSRAVRAVEHGRVSRMRCSVYRSRR